MRAPGQVALLATRCFATDNAAPGIQSASRVSGAGLPLTMADRAWLDHVMIGAGAKVAGGTNLFGLYEVENAANLQDRLARAYVWTRVFPYSKTLIRLGIPAPDQRQQLECAL